MCCVPYSCLPAVLRLCPSRTANARSSCTSMPSNAIKSKVGPARILARVTRMCRAVRHAPASCAAAALPLEAERLPPYTASLR